MNAAQLAPRHCDLVKRNRLIVEALRTGAATVPRLAARYQVTRERIRQIGKAGVGR